MANTTSVTLERDVRRLDEETLKAIANITITPGRVGPVGVTITVLDGNFGGLDAKEIELTVGNQADGIERAC